MAINKRDRFINPIPQEHREVTKAKLLGLFDSTTPSLYEEHLAYALFGVTHSSIRDTSILNYNPKTSPPKPPTPIYKLTSEATLDAPELVNDYYLNPLCWGYPLVYIGLGTQLYFYDAKLKKSGAIPSNNTSPITSLAANAAYVARADESKVLEIIDTQTMGTVNTHNTDYVFSQIVCDKENKFYLCSNKSDAVMHYDPRSNNYPFIIQIPDQPIGIAFNPVSQTLGVNTLESIQLLDVRQLRQPTLEFKEHKSPSKALCFFGKNKIASGGGSRDQYIKIWDTQTGKLYSEVNTGAQVCNIHWIDANNIATTSGYSTNNVNIYRQHGKTLYLDAQTALPERVLYSAQNPADPTKFITGNVSEQLNLWSIWKKQKTIQKQDSYYSDLVRQNQIR